MLLSGSFSAFAGAVVGLILLLRKLSVRSGAFVGAVAICVMALLSSDLLGPIVVRRVQSQFRSENRVGLMPLNLATRLGYWEDHVRITWEEGAILTGFGPQGLSEYAPGDRSIHRNPESFYSTLVVQSGLLSLLAYGVLNGVLFRRLGRLTRWWRSIGSPLPNRLAVRYTRLTWLLLIMFLVTHVGNPTMYYGGSLELFAMIVVTCYLLWMHGKSLAPRTWMARRP